VDANIQRNFGYVIRHMRRAKEKGADVIHFPEGALSGYAGADFESFRDFPWPYLAEATRIILEQARQMKLWVILGSAHPLSGKHKPHNSVYVISDQGKIVDRYDKMFCAGSRSEKDSDLAHYSPGNHFCTFSIRGVKCGILICHDFRYPELYRQYKRRGAQVMFHSYHAGHLTPKLWKEISDYVGRKNHRRNGGQTLPGILMPATMQSMAANNYLWISCSNTSAKLSCWPSFVVRPDGVIVGKLRRHSPGILVTKIDLKEAFYDSTVAWRDRAIGGIFHSGTLVKDPRSQSRTSY
jgi:predicted amidohydrolase